MKKISKIVLFAVCAALCIGLFMFAGCDERNGEQLSGTMTFVLDDKNGTIETVQADLADFTASDSALDVIKKLTEEKKMCYKGSDGAYGMMLSDVGIYQDGAEKYIVRQNEAEGKYVYIYTNVEKDKNDYEGMTTVEYAGQTLAESLNSISRMSIEDGAIVYLTTIVWAS